MVEEGPQALRSSNRARAAADLGCPPERMSLPQMTLHQATTAHEQHVASLQAERDHLLEQLHRSQVFLKAYQLRLHGEDIDLTAEEDAAARESALTPPWLVSKDSMSPLLVAYDMRVQELEGQAEAQQVQLDTLYQRTQDLVAQNAQLRSELRQSTESALKVAEASEGEGRGSLAAVSGSVAVAEEINELNERLEVLMAENLVLVEQNTIMDQELDAARADARDRDAAVAEMTANFREASEAVRKFEAHCEELQKEKAAAEELARAQASEMGRSDLLLRELQGQVEEARSVANGAVADRDAHQGALAEYRDRFEQETDALSDRVSSTVERLRERDALCADQAEQIEELNRKLVETSAAYDATNVKCANMLRTMRKMERDLAGYAEYDEAVKKLVSESKEKAEECLLARDKMLMLQKRSGEEIARLVQQNRDDAVRALRDQQAAVGETRARFQQVLDTREQEVADQVEQIARLHAELEEVRAAHRAAAHERDLLKRGVGARKDALAELWQDLEERIAAAESARDQALALSAENEAQRDRALADLDAERQEGAKRQRAFDAAVGAREAELDAVREQLRTADRKIEDAGFNTDLLEGRVRDYEERLRGAAAAAADQRKTIEADVREQLTSLNAALDAEVARRRDAEETAQRRIKDLKDGHEGAALESRRVLHEQQAEAGRLRARLDELNAQVTELMTARTEAEQQAHEANEAAEQVQDLLDDAERRLGESSLQLSAALGASQQHIREQQKMRSELDTARLEKARVQRELESTHRALEESQRQVQHLNSQQVRMLAQPADWLKTPM